MSKRRSLKIRHKRKTRKSIFLTPKTSEKDVTHSDSCSAEAAVQFFDNHTEPDAMSEFRPLRKSQQNCDRYKNASTGNNKMYTLSLPEPDFKPLRKSLQTCNRDSILPKTEDKIPPSFETVAEFKPLRKSQKTYAQAIRQSMPTTGGYILGTGPPSVSEHLLSSANSDRTNTLSTKTPHMKDQDSEECERYQQLLTLIEPSLYDVNNSFEKSSNKNSLSFEQECSVLLSTPLTAATIVANNSLSLPAITLDDYAYNEEDFIDMCSRAETNSIKSLRIQEQKVEEISANSSSDDSKIGAVFRSSYHLKKDWLENHRLKCIEKKNIRLYEKLNKTLDEKGQHKPNDGRENDLIKLLKNIHLINRERIVIIDDLPEIITKDGPKVIALTNVQNARIKAGTNGSLDQVLISKFNINITRRDLRTLVGHNWLNDEVINFYMNLLNERSEQKHMSHGLPLVYAFNTFFIPRLIQSGYSGVKRWTRKIDIFAKEIIPVPVHVGGVHWCMAIIHLRNRTIKYYDSMGRPNPRVLQALEQYLKEESRDKRQQHLDTSQFQIESVLNVPRQMNGSDCGVFSCMFAEYITRNANITFSQENMEYFREKMILEILEGKLMD